MFSSSKPQKGVKEASSPFGGANGPEPMARAKSYSSMASGVSCVKTTLAPGGDMVECTFPDDVEEDVRKLNRLCKEHEGDFTEAGNPEVFNILRKWLVSDYVFFVSNSAGEEDIGENLAILCNNANPVAAAVCFVLCTHSKKIKLAANVNVNIRPNFFRAGAGEPGFFSLRIVEQGESLNAVKYLIQQSDYPLQYFQKHCTRFTTILNELFEWTETITFRIGDGFWTDLAGKGKQIARPSVGRRETAEIIRARRAELPKPQAKPQAAAAVPSDPFGADEQEEQPMQEDVEAEEESAPPPPPEPAPNKAEDTGPGVSALELVASTVNASATIHRAESWKSMFFTCCTTDPTNVLRIVSAGISFGPERSWETRFASSSSTKSVVFKPHLVIQAFPIVKDTTPASVVMGYVCYSSMPVGLRGEADVVAKYAKVRIPKFEQDCYFRSTMPNVDFSIYTQAMLTYGGGRKQPCPGWYITIACDSQVQLSGTSYLPAAALAFLGMPPAMSTVSKPVENTFNAKLAHMAANNSYHIGRKTARPYFAPILVYVQHNEPGEAQQLLDLRVVQSETFALGGDDILPPSSFVSFYHEVLTGGKKKASKGFVVPLRMLTARSPTFLTHSFCLLHLMYDGYFRTYAEATREAATELLANGLGSAPENKAEYAKLLASVNAINARYVRLIATKNPDGSFTRLGPVIAPIRMTTLHNQIKVASYRKMFADLVAAVASAEAGYKAKEDLSKNIETGNNNQTLKGWTLKPGAAGVHSNYNF